MLFLSLLDEFLASLFVLLIYPYFLLLFYSVSFDSE
jgi:hypothetical protein